MQKEISLFQISKILSKNWKLIFLFTFVFTIISYSLSYTFKEIYGTSIKFFKPEINKDNLNEDSLLCFEHSQPNPLLKGNLHF